MPKFLITFFKIFTVNLKPTLRIALNIKVNETPDITTSQLNKNFI